MLKVIQTEEKRGYKIIQGKAKQKEQNWKTIIDLTLIPQHSISNSFSTIGDIIEEMSIMDSSFEDWYVTVIKSYVESKYNVKTLIQNVPKFLDYSERYVDKQMEYFYCYRETSESSSNAEFNIHEVLKISL